VNDGRPKAADELARRAAEREKAKATEETPKPDPSPAPSPEPESSGSKFGGKFSAADAGGAVLALVFWSWIVLPILQGGPDKMKNVLRAKFLNKGPKGEWLP
jgi:hypothetical protein